ncbi:MAG: tRNA (N6-isopentenyl adenosine(37)-C2)-methylthiotransferase MiaB, partial [Oligoflexus sp.]
MSVHEEQVKSTKKVFVETWGCQMNVADSESMLGMLKARAYETTDKAEEADLVLLNTCHIREKATHKVLSRLGTLRQVAEKNPKMKIAVTGCVAQAEGEKLLTKADNIDILVGPGKIHDLTKLIDQHAETGRPATALGFAKDRGAEGHIEPGPLNQPAGEKPTLSGKSEISRYVNIAQGCDNFCTFCVVPFTRGREVSRSPQEILNECQRLVAEGGRHQH